MHLFDVEALLVVIQIKRSLSHQSTFLVADDQHVVIETRYGNVVVLIV